MRDTRDNLPSMSRGELLSELLSSPCLLLVASLRSVLTLSSFSMFPGSLSQSCILRQRDHYPGSLGIICQSDSPYERLPALDAQLVPGLGLAQQL